MSKDYKILFLKSGFVSLGDDDHFKLVISDKKQDPKQRPNFFNIQNILGNARLVDDFEQGPYYVNEDVIDIYEEIQINNSYIRDFDNREKILRLALTCFGECDFEVWCLAQTHSHYLSASHILYLKDLFDFLVDGRRKFLALSWDNLLDKTEQGHQRQKNIDDLMESFAIFKQHEPDMRLENIISLWTSRKDGFKDLVIFLRNVFGRK